MNIEQMYGMEVDVMPAGMFWYFGTNSPLSKIYIIKLLKLKIIISTSLYLFVFILISYIQWCSHMWWTRLLLVIHSHSTTYWHNTFTYSQICRTQRPWSANQCQYTFGRAQSSLSFVNSKRRNFATVDSNGVSFLFTNSSFFISDRLK